MGLSYSVMHLLSISLKCPNSLGLILRFYHERHRFNCGDTEHAFMLKLNKTTSHKEQEHSLLFNEIPMVI